MYAQAEICMISKATQSKRLSDAASVYATAVYKQFI
jgi:hypothetical protein